MHVKKMLTPLVGSLLEFSGVTKRKSQ